LLSSFCPPNLTSASSRRRSGCKDLNDRKRRVWTLWDWTISIQFKCLSNETLKCPSTHLDT
jgi:activator of HSP90 ATPase